MSSTLSASSIVQAISRPTFAPEMELTLRFVLQVPQEQPRTFTALPMRYVVQQHLFLCERVPRAMSFIHVYEVPFFITRDEEDPCSPRVPLHKHISLALQPWAHSFPHVEANPCMLYICSTMRIPSLFALDICPRGS